MEKMKNETKAALVWGIFCIIALVACCFGNIVTFGIALAGCMCANRAMKYIAPKVYEEMWRIGE